MDAVLAGAGVGWILLHVGALAWAWATRVALGSRLEMPMQLGFFVAMGGVGCAAWICRHLELTVWLASAATLMAMVLTAVIDFRQLGGPIRSPNPSASC